MINVMAEAGQAVTNKCADYVTCSQTGACPRCDGCSIAISHIHKKYEVYTNNMFADLFKEHSSQMFNKLHEANLLLETL